VLELRGIVLELLEIVLELLGIVRNSALLQDLQLHASNITLESLVGN